MKSILERLDAIEATRLADGDFVAKQWAETARRLCVIEEALGVNGRETASAQPGHSSTDHRFDLKLEVDGSGLREEIEDAANAAALPRIQERLAAIEARLREGQFKADDRRHAREVTSGTPFDLGARTSTVNPAVTPGDTARRIKITTKAAAPRPAKRKAAKKR